ncbi:MAG: hypothetical protein ACTSUN_09015 [Promethearchaeota archaeon]
MEQFIIDHLIKNACLINRKVLMRSHDVPPLHLDAVITSVQSDNMKKYLA